LEDVAQKAEAALKWGHCNVAAIFDGLPFAKVTNGEVNRHWTRRAPLISFQIHSLACSYFLCVSSTYSKNIAMARATRSSTQQGKKQTNKVIPQWLHSRKGASKKRKRTSIAENNDQPAAKQLRSGDVNSRKKEAVRSRTVF